MVVTATKLEFEAESRGRKIVVSVGVNGASAGCG